MTTKTETITYVSCDICTRRDLKGRKHQVIINGVVWDICFHCFEGFEKTIEFLSKAGIDVDWRERGGK